MKKGLKKLAVILAAVSLTGCQNDTPPAPDITSGIENGTKSDVSEAIGTADISIGEVTDSGEEVFIPKLLMDTDKPFVLAEEHYLIEKQDIDATIFNEYGFPNYGYAAEGKYYYAYSAEYVGGNSSSQSQDNNEAKICVYDSESGKCLTLYSETLKSEGDYVGISIKMIAGSYLYFYREKVIGLSENQSFEMTNRDLFRINLRDNTTEKIFSYMDEEVIAESSPVIWKDILFIPTAHSEYNDYRSVIYQYDMNTGEISLFRDRAQYPVLYNNGILYFHDGGYYYHGEASDINGRGVFYEDDELIFYSEFEYVLENLTSNIGSDVLIYSCTDDDENFIIAGSIFGIFDKDFNKKIIAHTEKNTWRIDIGDFSKTGLVAINAPKPLIYDVNKECFAVIPIDDYEYYGSFTTDDGVYLFAYEYDSDFNYVSAALYTVKRR